MEIALLGYRVKRGFKRRIFYPFEKEKALGQQKQLYIVRNVLEIVLKNMKSNSRY